MSSGELHRALARATGESVRTIKRFGFSLMEPSAADFDDDVTCAGPQVVDWDALEAERVALAIQA